MAVGTMIQDSYLFVGNGKPYKITTTTNEKYAIGTYNSKEVSVDPQLNFLDIRIYDINNNELINLANEGFTTFDLI